MERLLIDDAFDADLEWRDEPARCGTPTSGGMVRRHARRATSEKTTRAGARIAGLKVTESVRLSCAVGCGQVVDTRDGKLVDIEGRHRTQGSGQPRRRAAGLWCVFLPVGGDPPQ